MNLNRLTSRENWFHIHSKRHLARVRTHRWPFYGWWCFVFSPRQTVPKFRCTKSRPSKAPSNLVSTPPCLLKGTFDKWNASMEFSSTDVRSGLLEIEIQADSVNTGSGLKNNKLKSKDFFDVKDSPTISFKFRKSFRLVQTHSTWKETLRFAGSRKPKNLLLQITARDQSPEALTARWPSIARITG
jgi:polyisoprenoid-binding protein YceI